MSEPAELRLEVLPSRQKKVWEALHGLASKLEKSGFYLAGGTALALQLGHRESVDFDFFSQSLNTGHELRECIERIFPNLVLRESDPDTLHAEVQGVRLSFIGKYKYPLIEPAHSAPTGIRLAGVLDIALMKLLAVSHRATVRDYLDLALVLRDRLLLSELLEAAKRKFGSGFNVMIPLRALVSFDDLDPEMPHVLDTRLEKSWRRILTDAVKTIS